MMKEKKEINKGVRITNTVYDFVEQQQGKGFNEKFENMVLYCMKNLPDIETEIKAREKYLKELDVKIDKKNSILNSLDSLNWNVESLKREIEQVIKKAKNIS